MKKVLSVIWMLLPFFFWILWITSALALSENVADNTNIMINLLYIKTFSGIWFLLGIITMLISIVYLWREEWLTQSEIIKPTWKLARKNIWKFWFWIALIFILQITQNELSDPSRPTTLLISVLIILLWIAYLRVDLWLKNLSLSLIQEKKARALDIFVNPDKFFKYFLAYLLMVLFTMIGVLLFIIPGIFVALRLEMVPYLILEENIWPWNAIKKSWEVTKSKVANLLALNIVLGAINILWLVAIIVGLFWTLPLFYLANAMFYKKLLLLKK